MNPILVCACGETQFWRTYRATGKVEQLIETSSPNRELVVETYNDLSKKGPEPAHIVCARCKKKHRNPFRKAKPTRPTDK